MFHSVEKPVEAVENSCFPQYNTKGIKKIEGKSRESEFF